MVQLVDHVHDVVARADVDAARGLVQEQQPRATEHRPRDEHPLLLAARAPGCVGREPAEPEPIEDLLGLVDLLRDGHGSRRPSIRAIKTASRTVTGKYQFTVSTCGT